MQDQQVLNKFLAQYTRQYISLGKYRETAQVLSLYDSPASEDMLPAYRTIAQKVLYTENENELKILCEMLK